VRHPPVVAGDDLGFWIVDGMGKGELHVDVHVTITCGLSQTVVEGRPRRT
jgi:hypothetical protein